MALAPGVKGGGGRHGSGHSSKNEKPGYMSHLPDEKLKTHSKHSDVGDSMTHQALMSGCGGGGEEA